MEFGIWSLELPWSLEFGVWGLFLMTMANDNPIEPEATGLPHPGDPMDELLLTRYLEGRLEIAESKALEASLRSSPQGAAARRRLDALREEERLIRDALEPLAEPSRRLGDRVIATLHFEERARRQAARTLRVRRHVFAALAVAASLLLCLWLVRPREAMGTAVSGTAATLQAPNGERRPLTKDSRFYEGDELITALGQFVRLRLSNGAVLDLDEHSKLSVEKAHPQPVFRLESGRMGVNTQHAEVLVHLPQGQVRVLPASLVDVWLPQPAQAVWPELLEPAPNRAGETPAVRTAGVPPASASAGEPDAALHPAAITMFSGTAYVANEKLPGGIAVAKGCRVLLWKQTRSITPLDQEASRVIETRQGQTWHALGGVGPQDRKLIGLLGPPDFEDLGLRFNLAGNTSPQVAKAVTEALALLEDAEQTEAPEQREKKLAAAQQALRLAYAPLGANDEHRPLGRLLEGLAHLERGRALVASGALAGSGTGVPPGATTGTVVVRTAAAAAFDAARVAFEESLRPDAEANLPLPADAKSDWARQLTAGPSVTLRDLSPANQAALLATFNHAVAHYWLARVGATGPVADGMEAQESAREFDALRVVLGRSVEALAARLAEGLALEAAAPHPTLSPGGRGQGEGAGPPKDRQAKAWRDKASAAFEDVLAAPLAGWSEPSRKCGDGLKQAALLALVRAQVASGEAAQARLAAEDFSNLYPLDEAGPVGQEIARLLK